MRTGYTLCDLPKQGFLYIYKLGGFDHVQDFFYFTEEHYLRGNKQCKHWVYQLDRKGCFYGSVKKILVLHQVTSALKTFNCLELSPNRTFYPAIDH